MNVVASRSVSTARSASAATFDRDALAKIDDAP
jgi:hypothetical protein